MTKEMLKELCEILKRRNSMLLVVIVILSIAVVGVSIFAMCQFEISYEDNDQYHVEYEAEVDNVTGSNNSMVQSFQETSKSLSDIAIVMICLTTLVAIIAVAIIIGVYLYGKRKNESYAHAQKEVDNQEKGHNQDQ